MKILFIVLFAVAFTALSNVAFAEPIPDIVPEPVSTTLFLLGGAVLAARRLRKK